MATPKDKYGITKGECSNLNGVFKDGVCLTPSGNTIRKGKIKDFQGSWMSGIATLVMETLGGRIENVSCDNAPTVRSLQAAFGDVIGGAHDVKPKGGHIGKEIYYTVESWGVMAGFIPVDEV